MSRVALVVLGMHRSGTSALTKVLGMAGASLPTDLMISNVLNPKGFFESSRVHELHEQMLAEFGSAWDDLSPMPVDWEKSGLANEYAGKMADVVLQEFGRSPLFVLKDPRICRLVPFWLDVLGRIDVESRFVIPVRNPLEVSASLARAHGMDEQRGRLLWLQHLLLAERDTRGCRRTFVTFDQLVEDWRRLLGRVVEENEIVLPRWSRRAEAEIDGFLTKALRHHEVAGEEVDVRADVAGWVRQAYHWAERAAAGGRPARKTLDRVADEFFAAESVFGPIVANTEHQHREDTAELVALREAARDHEARQQANEIAVETSPLEERIEEVSGTMKKMMFLWLADMQRKGLVEEPRLDQILSDLRADQGQFGPEIELVQLAAERESVGLGEQSAARIETLETELSAARAGLERMQAVQQERDSVRDRNARLEAELEQRRREQERADTRDEEHERELARLREEHARAAVWLARAESAEARLAQAEQQIVDRGAALEESHATLADLRSVQGRLPELEQERETLRSEVIARDEELGILRQRSHSTSLDYEGRVVRLEGELEHLRGVEEKLSGELLSVRNLTVEAARLEACVEDQARLLEEASASRMELAPFEERVASLERALADREARLEAALAGVASGTARVTEIESKLSDRDAELLASRTSLAERTAELSSSRDRHRLESAEVQERVATLEGELADRNTRLEAALAGVASGTKRVTEIESKLSDRDAELLASRTSLTERTAELSTSRDRHRLESAGIRDRVTTLRGELADRNTRLEAALAGVASGTARVTEIESKLSDRDAELLASRTSLTERTAELSTSRDRHRLESAEVQERVATLEGELADRNTRLETALAGVASGTARMNEIESKLSDRDAELLVSSTSLAERTAEQSVSRTSIAGLQEELVSLREELAQAREQADQNQQLEAALESKEIELQRHRAALREVSRLRERLIENEQKFELFKEEEGRLAKERTNGLVAELESAGVVHEDLRLHAAAIEAELAEMREARENQIRAEREEIGRRFDPRLPGAFRRETSPGSKLLNIPSGIWSAPKRLAKLLHWTLTLRLRQRLRERRVADRIRESGLFDVAYYLAASPESPEAIGDPILHYVRDGAAEGRDPSAAFDTDFYQETNEDVRSSGANPLDHFESHGWKEGRRPHPLFDPLYYLSAHSDVSDSGENPLLHWLRDGWREGRYSVRPEALREFRSSWISETSNAPSSPGTPSGATFESPSGSGLAEAEAGSLSPASGQLPQLPMPASAIFEVRKVESDLVRTADPGDPVVVVATHELPCPPRAGNQYRILRYVRWLESRGYQVLIVHSPLSGVEVSDTEIADAMGMIENLVVCDRSGEVRFCVAPHFERMLSDLSGRSVAGAPAFEKFDQESDEAFRQRAWLEHSYCPDALVSFIQHADNELPPGTFVIAIYVWMTRFVPALRAETRCLIDTLDQFSAKAEKVESHGITGEHTLTGAQERGMLLRGDVIMAIQTEEAASFRELVPDRPVLTAGVDFDGVSFGDFEDPSPDPSIPILGFIGSGNAMNVKGIRDFLKHAWPLLQRDVPNVKLRIGGKVCASVPKGIRGVETLGGVEELADFYRECQVIINPVAPGTGLKIKTVEAIAHGLPVVTWPLGVEGVPSPLMQFCHVVTDWYDFYAQVRELVSSTSLGPDASRAQREVASKVLSAEAVYAMLGEEVDRHCRSRMTHD